MDYQPFLNRDCKSLSQPRQKHLLHRPHVHVLALSLAVISGIILMGPSEQAEATRAPQYAASLPAATEAAILPLALPQQQSPQLSTSVKPDAETTTDTPWQTVEVKSGDTLAAIFQRLKLSPSELNAVVNAGEEAKRLTRLYPGQSLRFQIAPEQRLAALRYPIDPSRTLSVERGTAGFSSHLITHPVETRLAYTSATIEDSLYLSGQRAGLSDNIIMELVNVFGWDIDFALDIRGGDEFTLLYEERWLNGEKLRDGAILAAEFINQGRSYRAVRFTNAEGRSDYYTPDGLSMRKAFLRSPVDFHRISSGFQRERWHPILGKKRPHRGVDYAARIGTPIKASGDGKIIFRGTKGGYGRTIILQHGGSYSTLYAHMNSYRRGLGVGSRVKQGQVIGYVGKSGMATGPHLHYEFRVNGVHRNPLTVKLPNAEPIPKQYRAAFELQSQRLLAQLDVVKRTLVALATP